MGTTALSNPPSQPIAHLWRQLQLTPIQPEAWMAIHHCYATAGLEPQRLYVRQQLQRLNARVQDELPKPSSEATTTASAAEQHLLNPCSEEARRWARELDAWLAANPGDWLSELYRLRLDDGASASGEPQRERLENTCKHEPIPGESLHWLGIWRLNGGDHSGAVKALAQLVDRRPVRHGSMLYLGEALLRTGNRSAAEVAFTRASHSSNPAFLRLLAQRVYQHNYWQEAVAVLERSLDLAPDSIETLLALARLHWEVYDLTAAEEFCRRVLRIDPGNGDVRYLLNALPGRRGDAAAHLAAVEEHHVELADPSSRLVSSIAMASLYVDTLSPEQTAQRHRDLCIPIEASVTPQPLAGFGNTLDPDRALRIGLVSGDFHRQHPVNLFMLPLLERLDAEQFAVTVFHTGTMFDEYTGRAREAASAWIEAGGLDDQALHQRIRDQQIDVLIDLAGHTSSHRLGVFALRSAPVQASFLGYPHSTGLSRIDWLIGDAIVSPAEHANLFSEGIAQLPGSVFCWSPVDTYPLPPARDPAAPLVFGSFNNIMKLSPSTIALWAALLRDLPDAQLLLKAPSLADASVIDRFRSLFAAEGIPTARLSFEGPTELSAMMRRYGAIDIALDPTPYNGGTTTLQALWMGVPVIALRGGNFVSRMGASFLTSLGKPEWIADDDAHYRSIARQLAEQLPAIRAGRAELRRQMADSPLSDLDRYAAEFQKLLRRLWLSHCQGRHQRLLQAHSCHGG
jgi:predicted O-linked N-acetylglucosamine transferase (SPINDLY family)